MIFVVGVLLCLPVAVESLSISTAVKIDPQHNYSSHSNSDKSGLLLAPLRGHGNASLPAHYAASAATLNGSKLVWFLGSSVDQHAVVDACNHANAAIIGDQFLHCYCTFDGFTLVYSFHPGATPPPYYAGTGFGVIEASTHETIESRLQEIKLLFGKRPDATIVESSLWDVANWWQRSGKPEDWPIPHEQIHHWSHETIPSFLAFVQGVNPHGRIAFRSPPTAFDNSWRDWTQHISDVIDTMCISLRASAQSETHLLPGNYPLLDYHKVVERTCKALGGPCRNWYKDALHPGPELGVAFVDVVLKWVNQL